MFFDDSTLDLIVRGTLLAVAAICWIVLLVRVVGLRSFSKMTNFDFIMTVATGSLLAGAAQATQWSGFAQAMVAILALFVFQLATSRLRKRWDPIEDAMQNDPVLLMRDGEFCESALREERVAKSDVIAKLREANVLDLSQVRAVVLETTGDVSVLHGDEVDDRLIENVRNVE